MPSRSVIKLIKLSPACMAAALTEDLCNTVVCTNFANTNSRCGWMCANILTAAA